MNFLSISLRRFVTCVGCCCTILVASCEREKTVDNLIVSTTSDPTLDYILSIGYRKETIVDYGSYYLVEGDIKFDKKLYGSVDKGAKRAQRFNNLAPIINHDIVGLISVRVDNSFPNPTLRQTVIDATQAAIKSWNDDIFGSKLNFVFFTGSSANITISYAGSSTGTEKYGLGSPPFNCGAGPTLELFSFITELNASQLHFVVAHELGHCVGFRHTNENYTGGPYLIPQTPFTDANSVMNSGGGPTARSWTGFTTYDVVATQVLYPSTATLSAVYNSSDDRVDVIWPPSYFCSENVTMTISKNGFISPAPYSTPNDASQYWVSLQNRT